MSLHFPLHVNGTEIGRFSAVHASGGTDADDVCSYGITIDRFYTTAPPFRPTRQRYTFTLEHRYGDGAWVLIAKALREAEAFLSGGAR